MKGLDFLEIVGEIDENYIREAEMRDVKTWSKKRILSYAASLLLLCTLSFVGYQYVQDTTNSTLNIAEVDMEDMGRSSSQEPAMIDESADEIIEETPDENEEKNIVEKIIGNIASFFNNLRSYQ